MKLRLVYTLLVVLLSQPLLGQSPTGGGRVPLGSYFNGAPDSINLFNGNLMLNIELFSQPGRELSTGLQLIYNAQGWKQVDDPVLGTYAFYDGGWRHPEPGPIDVKYNLLQCYWVDPYFDVAYEVWVEWKDASGAMHVYYPEVAVEGHFDTCDFGEVAAAWLNQQGGTIWGIRRREPMAAACATPALWS